MLLWLVSTWAAALNWCCELPTRATWPASHEAVERGIHQEGHDHTSKVHEDSQHQPDEPDCAEFSSVDKGLRLAEGALPNAIEFAYALRLILWLTEVPQNATGSPTLHPPPIFAASPFLATIRLLL